MFVDPSGRRGRLVRHAGVVAGAVCLGYSVVLAVGFAGGTAFAPETLIPGRPIATEAFGRQPESGPERTRPEHRRPSSRREMTHHGPRGHQGGPDTGGTAPRAARPVALGQPVALDESAPARPRPASAEPAARARPEGRERTRERTGKKARHHTRARHKATGKKSAAHRAHTRTRPAGRKPGHRAERPKPARHSGHPGAAKPAKPAKPVQRPRPARPAMPGGAAAHTPANWPPAAQSPAAGGGLPQNPVPNAPLNPQVPQNPADAAPVARPPGVPQNGNAPS
ncbi:hypothetical protein [Streptomyces sp. NPDC048636]|uniref:hypothetical protein n=1 Tax=Streptomyces sp. NPDC048636 TaxID=3155762 RepID=UPI0034136EDF